MVQAHRELLLVQTAGCAQVGAGCGEAVALVGIEELLDAVVGLDGLLDHVARHIALDSAVDKLIGFLVDDLLVLGGEVQALAARRAVVRHRVVVGNLVKQLVGGDVADARAELRGDLLGIDDGIGSARRNGARHAGRSEDLRVLHDLAGTQDGHVLGGVLPILEGVELKAAGKELGGRDSGGAACLSDGAGLADALCKLEGQIIGAARIPDEVQVDFFAALGELVNHLVFGEEVLVALDLDGLEQVDDVLRHSGLELGIPTLELLGGHMEVEFLLKLDALAEAARSLEHVLVVQRQENRLHVETNFLMFFDGHDDYPFPCSAALSPVPC